MLHCYQTIEKLLYIVVDKCTVVATGLDKLKKVN